jgi:hypothetical protein
MEINTQESSGMMNGMPPSINQERKMGPIIAVLIIVLVLIIASLFYFGKNLNTRSVEDYTAVDDVVPARNDEALSASTDSAVLEADLDAQLKDIDSSF